MPAAPVCPRQLLLQVLDGASYAEVAAAHQLGRDQVAATVRELACRLQQVVGVVDVDEMAVPSLALLHRESENYREALEHYQPGPAPADGHSARVASKHDLARLLHSAAHSPAPLRDSAIILTLFATGARTDEIVDLCVADYLARDGSVRTHSRLRAAIAFNGLERPLLFLNPRAVRAIDAYLCQRAKDSGAAAAAPYRGLAPDSPLFLGQDGAPIQHGRAQGLHSIQGILRQLMRRSQLPHLGLMTARRTLAFHLRRHGVKDGAIADLLGLRDKSTLYRLLRAQACSLEQTMQVFP